MQGNRSHHNLRRSGRASRRGPASEMADQRDAHRAASGTKVLNTFHGFRVF